jgi:hypothetical protein
MWKEIAAERQAVGNTQAILGIRTAFLAEKREIFFLSNLECSSPI